MGKIQIQEWFGNGIKRAALMNKWVLKGVAIDEDERCLLQTDGSFLYLLCKDGLYKVGSGYSGTVRVRNRDVSVSNLCSKEVHVLAVAFESSGQLNEMVGSILIMQALKQTTCVQAHLLFCSKYVQQHKVQRDCQPKQEKNCK